MRISILPFLAAGAIAQTVTYSNVVVIGTSSGSLHNFAGIPYAAAPTGILRLKPPVSFTVPAASTTTVTYTQSPRACPQFSAQTDSSNLGQQAQDELNQLPFFKQMAAAQQGEDCLTLNIQRPDNANANSNLPVLVWIYGGAFGTGSTNDVDGHNPIVNANLLGKPFIFVQMNYRLGGFGFLAGSQLSSEGSTNLGLRDQRLALQWVQDNIAKFGGNPNQVTLFGESAGSISVYDHLIINGGSNLYKNKPLFHRAIMASGSIIPTQPVTSTKAQDVFNTVARNAGCDPTNANVLTCLRGKDYQTYFKAANSVPSPFGYTSLNLSYLPRPDTHDGFFSVSPEVAIQNGAIVKVPVIIGDMEDEGTLFSLMTRNISTDAQLRTYLKSYFPTTSSSAVDTVLNQYPDDDGTAGSPFRTGNLNNLYGQFKRLSAVFGDLVFNLQRRYFLNRYCGFAGVTCYSYLGTYLYGTPFLGSAHGIDVSEFYSSTPKPGAAASIQTHWAGFIAGADPNLIQTPSTNQQRWQPWTAAGLFMLRFTDAGYFGGANAVITDNYRSNAYSALVANLAALRI